MRLLKNTLIYTFVLLFQRAVGFFLLPLYTACLTTADYGIVNVVMSVVNFLSIFALLSLDGAARRFDYKYSEDPARRDAIWGTVVLFILGNSTVLTAVLFLTHRFTLDPFLKGVPFYPYMFLGLLAMWWGPLLYLYQSFLSGRQHARRYAGVALASSLTAVALTLVFVVALRWQARGLLLATVVTNAVFFVYTLAVFLPRIRLSFSWAHLRECFGYSLPLVPHSLAGWALNLIDRLFLSHFRNLATVGIYSVGYQFGNVLNVVTYAANQAYSPWFFEKAEQGETGKQRIVRIAPLMILMYCFAGLLLSLFSPEVLRVMVAPDYREAWRVVPWITFSFVWVGVYYIYVNTLFLERTRWVPLVTGLSAVGGIGANLLLVPRLGMMGAAISSFLANAFSAFVSMVLARWHVPLPFPTGRVLLSVAVFFGLSLMVYGGAGVPAVSFLILKAMVAALAGTAILLRHRDEARELWQWALQRWGGA